MLKEDWGLLTKFFPSGWQKMAYQTGALLRKRKIASPEILMRVLLIHLADGKSLRTTAAYAKEANLCSINDTALLKRLKASGEWFRWISINLLKLLDDGSAYLNQLSDRFRFRLIDGTTVSEPGSTGTDWRIHYALNLKNLHCDTMEITDAHTGESLSLYSVRQGDIILADRNYCKRNDISYVLKHGGNVIIRLHYSNLPLKTYQGTSFSLIKKLQGLPEGEIGDWNVYFINSEGKLTKGRLCATRKSKEAIERAMVVRNSILPPLGLASIICRWPEIRVNLAENSRKRQLQINNINDVI